MRVPAFNPTGVLAPLRSFLDAVRGILSNGWTIADQSAGDLKTFEWSGSAVTISTKLRTRPLSVQMLGAVARVTPNLVVSGGAVSWEWVGDENGSIAISSVAVGAGTYDVTLWIVGG